MSALSSAPWLARQEARLGRPLRYIDLVRIVRAWRAPAAKRNGVTAVQLNVTPSVTGAHSITPR